MPAALSGQMVGVVVGSNSLTEATGEAIRNEARGEVTLDKNLT